jgi:sugar/nucleoside kinase (ribokinase family)
VDSFAEHVVDAVGAGDALVAYSTLALVGTKHPLIASILGSVAAAMACERDGNNPIGPEEIVGRLDRIEKQTMMQPVPALALGAPNR